MRLTRRQFALRAGGLAAVAVTGASTPAAGKAPTLGDPPSEARLATYAALVALVAQSPAYAQSGVTPEQAVAQFVRTFRQVGPGQRAELESYLDAVAPDSAALARLTADRDIASAYVLERASDARPVAGDQETRGALAQLALAAAVAPFTDPAMQFDPYGVRI
jgi:hypothetical protein